MPSKQRASSHSFPRSTPTMAVTSSIASLVVLALYGTRFGASAKDQSDAVVTVLLGCVGGEVGADPTRCFPPKNLVLSADAKTASAGFGGGFNRGSPSINTPDLATTQVFTLAPPRSDGDSDGRGANGGLSGGDNVMELQCLAAMQAKYGGVCLNEGVCKFKRPNCAADAPYSLPVCDCGAPVASTCFWGRCVVRACGRAGVRAGGRLFAAEVQQDGHRGVSCVRACVCPFSILSYSSFNNF